MEPQPLFDFVFDPSFNEWVLEQVGYEDPEQQQQQADDDGDDDVF